MPLRPLAILLLLNPVLAQTSPSPAVSPAASAPVAATPEGLWSRASEAVVTFESKEGSGLGFLVLHKGTVCVITSQDTLFLTRSQTVKTKSGKMLSVSKFFLSESGDVALGRFDKAPEGVSPLESFPDPGQLVAKQKLLSAYPDKTLQTLEISAVKNDVIETLLPQVPKPSQAGYPVLDPQDGKVVGFFSPVFSLQPLNSPTAVEGSDRVEFFKASEQTRLTRWDKVEKWMEFTPGRARDEGLRLQRFQDHTRQVGVFLQQGASYKESCEVTRAFQKYTEEVSRPRLQPDFYATQHSQFLSYFPVLAKRDMDVLSRDSVYFYPWNRVQATEMLRVRSEVVAKAAELVKAQTGAFSKPSAR